MPYSALGARILVDDFAACHHFYHHTLGLVPHWGDASGPYASFSLAPDGEPVLALFAKANMPMYQGYTPPAATTGADGSQLVLVVPNVDAACEELARRGAALLGPAQTIEDWGMRCAWLRDPEGNLIELNESGPA